MAALAQGRNQHAARLMGAAEALRQVLGLPVAAVGWWCRPRERIEEAVRAASLASANADAWAEGRAMTLEEALTYATEDVQQR